MNVQRFWSKVDRSGECWLWRGTQTPDGYGRFWDGTREVQAHRFAYEAEVGPIPDGLQLDHLCRVHPCVRPAHLEPVTQRENVLRGVSFAAENARKTACPNGHPYVSRTDRRVCATCHKAVAAVNRDRNRDAIRERGRRYYRANAAKQNAARLARYHAARAALAGPAAAADREADPIDLDADWRDAENLAADRGEVR